MIVYQSKVKTDEEEEEMFLSTLSLMEIWAPHNHSTTGHWLLNWTAKHRMTISVGEHCESQVKNFLSRFIAKACFINIRLATSTSQPCTWPEWNLLWVSWKRFSFIPHDGAMYYTPAPIRTLMKIKEITWMGALGHAGMGPIVKADQRWANSVKLWPFTGNCRSCWCHSRFSICKGYPV